MAAVAMHHNLGALHQDKSPRYPRYYSNHPQEERPPLFVKTGSWSQSSDDGTKASHVLGLVGQFERKSIEEEQQRGRPVNAQRALALSNGPRRMQSVKRTGSRRSCHSFEQKRALAEARIRRLSRMQDMAVTNESDEGGAAADDEQSDSGNLPSQRPHHGQNSFYEEDEDEEEAEQPDPEKRVFLEISLQGSPQQLSFPEAPIELDAGPDHELLLPPRRPRPRPHSYTAPRFSDRPTNKIASSRSRGLSSNSVPPNFTRPLSSYTPKPIPGEDMERDPLSIRFQDLEDDPRSPMSPIGGTLVSNEIKAALEKLEMGISKARVKPSSVPPTSPPPPPAANRRSRPRWSSLPSSLMKLTAKKRTSKSEEDYLLLPGHFERKESKEVVTLTEENLQRWEDEVGYVPKMYRLGCDLLKSPPSPDMHSRKTPSSRLDAVATANAAGQMLTPPMSPPTSPPLSDRTVSASTICAMRSPSLPTPSLTPKLSPRSFVASPSIAIRSSTTSVLISRFPDVPSASTFPASAPPPTTASLAQQKEALSMKPNQLLTCVLCKEVEHPSAFPAQPLSAECLHASRVCKECVQHWVERCVEKGSSVKCPECGVGMGVEEVLGVVGKDMLRGIAHRWENRGGN